MFHHVSGCTQNGDLDMQYIRLHAKLNFHCELNFLEPLNEELVP